MPPIKFIFFDLGNVLLNFEHERLVRQVSKLADIAEEDVENVMFRPPHDIENRFERGELNSQQFHELFCQHTKRQVQQEDLMLAIADIFWLNTSIVHVVAQLKSINFPMGILSNTCEAHWNFARKKFTAVGQLFDQRILSYEEKSMKPDCKIYEAAIQLAHAQTGCKPEEIFFTDDKQENVTAAIEAGMQAELFRSASQLFGFLLNAGVWSDDTPTPQHQPTIN